MGRGNRFTLLAAKKCHFQNSPADLGDVIISFIFFFVFVGIAGFWLLVKSQNPRVSRIFPLHCFELAIFCALVYGFSSRFGYPEILVLMLIYSSYILLITDDFLYHCSDTWDALDGIWVGFNVIFELKDLLILGIILLRLTPYVLKETSRTRHLTRNATVFIMAVIVALFVPFVVLISVSTVGYQGFRSEHIVTSSMKLAAAYYFLLLCAAVCVALVLLYSVAILEIGRTLSAVIQSR
ncbi:hypothetical protein GP486_000431 [Trichoglossum hirsutum]|uniref:Uncharacterized protein n=1 Tax=Trichoglossum hirsutum TaxID=265104 RepID=A0A9P8RU21_9PEZI|nr:hypothetical protein GP486_000431 [Trichoglossum hirsutum]